MTPEPKAHRIRPTAIMLAVHVAIGASTALPLMVAAQPVPADKTPTLARVEITGSSIKRLEAETSLPLEVITRDVIEKSGATTAEQLMAQIAASVGAVEEKQQNTDTQKNSGFSGANLRGLGVSSTLVLLNGRRMANYAFGGQGVDLLSSPKYRRQMAF